MKFTDELADKKSLEVVAISDGLLVIFEYGYPSSYEHDRSIDNFSNLHIIHFRWYV